MDFGWLRPAADYFRKESQIFSIRLSCNIFFLEEIILKKKNYQKKNVGF